MSEEIVYTSAKRGLKSGSSGFCTVGSSAGMAAPIASFLESLSAYRHLDVPGGKNPVVYSHLTTKIAGRELHVLSRVADAGLDYSGRSNKLAHHLAIERTELSQSGPTWLQRKADFHLDSWEGGACILPPRKSLPQGDSAPRIASSWESLTGDAGWAGVLAKTATEPRPREQWIVYPRGTNMLLLLDEAMSLLPANLKWNVTYSTFCISLPAHLHCRWCCIPEGTPEAEQLRRRRELKVIDLTSSLSVPEEDKWVIAARTGQYAFTEERKTSRPAAGLTQSDDLSKVSLEGFDSESDVLELEPLVTAPPPIPGFDKPVTAKRFGRSRAQRNRKFLLATLVIATTLLLIATAFFLVSRLNIVDKLNAALATNEKPINEPAIEKEDNNLFQEEDTTNKKMIGVDENATEERRADTTTKSKIKIKNNGNATGESPIQETNDPSINNVQDNSLVNSDKYDSVNNTNAKPPKTFKDDEIRVPQNPFPSQSIIFDLSTEWRDELNYEPISIGLKNPIDADDLIVHVYYPELSGTNGKNAFLFLPLKYDSDGLRIVDNSDLTVLELKVTSKAVIVSPMKRRYFKPHEADLRDAIQRTVISLVYPAEESAKPARCDIAFVQPYNAAPISIGNFSSDDELAHLIANPSPVRIPQARNRIEKSMSVKLFASGQTVSRDDPRPRRVYETDDIRRVQIYLNLSFKNPSFQSQLGFRGRGIRTADSFKYLLTRNRYLRGLITTWNENNEDYQLSLDDQLFENIKLLSDKHKDKQKGPYSSTDWKKIVNTAKDLEDKYYLDALFPVEKMKKIVKDISIDYRLEYRVIGEREGKNKEIGHVVYASSDANALSNNKRYLVKLAQ